MRCAAVSGLQGQDLLLIASQDCTVSLWNLQGGLVGVMGKHTWTLSDPSTWQDPKASTPSCMLQHQSVWHQAFAQTCIISTSLYLAIAMLSQPVGLRILVDLHVCLCTSVSKVFVSLIASALPCGNDSSQPDYIQKSWHT